MHWIVQENLINPATRDELLRLLTARGTPYTLARLKPIFNVLDNEVADPVGPVFVYGSTGLGEVSKARGWAPGYFDENLDYSMMLREFGRLALNHDAICLPLGMLSRERMSNPPEDFFIRPVHDNKSFAGCTMNWAELAKFQAGVESVADHPDVTLRLRDRVVLAPLKDIDEEYRFFVIGGRVVTGSRYKDSGVVRSSTEIPAHIATFAQRCVEHWSPNAAYTLDLADTDEGPKVLEQNSANASGEYGCDLGAIVDAVNALPV